MLIKSAPTTRWRRDPGIAELIDHFDRPERAGRLDLLTAKEMSVLESEWRKCRDDFIYAARNYFYIVDENGDDMLFRLWESQELVLDELFRLRDKGKAQKILIIKARRLGVSTLAESLIAWRTMFFTNTSGIVVSASSGHAQYLFGIMLHIHDQMPWWLKPMLATRSYKEGLLFDNPDPDRRRDEPGLHSLISVQAATQTTGVGQGTRVSAGHVSEFSDFPQEVARDIIEGDLEKAISQRVNSFAILESTAKGAGTYSHNFWKTQVKMAERAKWLPLFLPWFFEKTRVLAPPGGWVAQQPELDMQKRVRTEWVRCDNPKCLRWEQALHEQEHREGGTCRFCGQGTLYSYDLTDSQLAWMWNERMNAGTDSKSAKLLKQEFASTANEAFQITGFAVFPDDVLEFVNSTCRPPLAVGNLDVHGAFHGVRHIIKNESGYPVSSTCWCEGCSKDHRWDDAPLKIWEWPIPGREYVLGADVAEGLGGDADYSVAWVNRVGTPGSPDVHVATYRSNTIDPIGFSAPLNFIGRMFNTALMSIEVNKFDACAHAVRFNYQYPNLFRWKHYDSMNVLSNKVHWVTQYNTKPRLWQTGKRWLLGRQWVIQDEDCLEEMKTFQKDAYDDRGGSAGTGFYDDLIMAALIALYTSHDVDFDEATGTVPLRGQVADGSLISVGEFEMQCSRCRSRWEADFISPRCPQCDSLMVVARRKDVVEVSSSMKVWDEMASGGTGLDDLSSSW